MVKNGTRGGKQLWYCNECAKERRLEKEKKEEVK
jgi:hypothetical protein